ncbi:hypothetical protein LUZ60_013355 [Juncus effusus]|nr:hypothetical protein LUZ60_013355 [Juncus effusus]
MEESNQNQNPNQDSDQQNPTQIQSPTLNPKQQNWSEHVENLLEAGEIDGAISFLESAVSSFSDDRQLVAAMSDLADLYSSRGFSMKSDELKSRALSVRARVERELPCQSLSDDMKELKLINVIPEENKGKKEIPTTSKKEEENDEEDWEAIADKVETDAEFLSLEPEIKTNNLQDLGKKEKNLEKKTKRRGRGSFLYKKSMLYSDSQDSEKLEIDCNEMDDLKDEEAAKKVEFGTRHVLVLYDFPTSTRTTELEKIFEASNDRGFAIRWVNDTCALAVFRTSSLAEEAKNDVPTHYKIRFLHDDDELLTQIKSRDLEPPYPRPKTSARTAQRMIAQSMGLRIKSPNFSVNEHKSQERERKNRIVTRQALRDEAWGPD